MVDRDLIVNIARTWVGTPYHHMARVKGQGVDCGQLLLAVFVEAEYAESFDPGYYTQDWHLHRDQDRYLELIEKYFDRAPYDPDDGVLDLKVLKSVPPPGDVLVFKVGRCFSHGAIITDWPNIIHAYLPSFMVEEVSVTNTPMSARSAKFYSPRITQ